MLMFPVAWKIKGLHGGLARLACVACVTLSSTSACSSITIGCTKIGCESGTTVHLASLPSGPFRIELRAGPPTGVAYVFECTDTASCRQDVFFPGMIADHFWVTVRAGAATRTTEIITVTYTVTRPNGPNCEPECRTALVTAQIPS